MNNRRFFDEYDDAYQASAPKYTSEPPATARAVTSMVIGGLSLLLLWVQFAFIFMALFFIAVNILGLMLAVSARKRNERAGHHTWPATVGMLLNIVSLIIYVIAFAIGGALVLLITSLFF